MSRSASRPRSRIWLRVLVLLVALWVPGVHAEAQAAPALGVSAESFEHDDTDALDMLVRPSARTVHRADVPERPAPLPGPAPGRPTARTRAVSPRVPYAQPLLRTVILRC